MIKIVDSGRPLAESDLQRLEQNLDVGLPRPYRAFLIAHNGGIPKPGFE
jgi:cell wall assembly regulator SMI1